MPTFPVITIKPSYNSIVRGCPGIPETLPRIECELRIRSNNGSPFIIDHIELFLKTIETIHPQATHSHTPNLASPTRGSHTPTIALPSTPFSATSFTSTLSPQSNNSLNRTASTSSSSSSSIVNKYTRVSLSYKKKLRVNTDSLPGAKEIVGIDVPVTIGIPDDIKATNYNENFGHTYTVIEACVFYKLPIHEKREKQSQLKTSIKSLLQEESPAVPELSIVQFETPINIERYDIYPNTKMFPPLKFKESSPDNRLDIVYRLNTTCFGTDDLVQLDLDIKHNMKYQNPQSTTPSLVFVGQKKKLKIKEITLEIKQVLERLNTHSGLIETKETTLGSQNKVLNELITNGDIKTRIDLRLVTMNEMFQKYETTMMSPEVMFKLPSDDPMESSSEIPSPVLFLKSKKKNGTEPLQYHSSITTRGNQYSITHYVVIKFRCSGILKNFELRQPITISFWCKPQVKYLESIIEEEKVIARNAKNFYDRFGGIKRVHKREGVLEYPPLPPIICPFDRETLDALGILYETKGSKTVRVPLIE